MQDRRRPICTNTQQPQGDDVSTPKIALYHDIKRVQGEVGVLELVMGVLAWRWGYCIGVRSAIEKQWGGRHCSIDAFESHGGRAFSLGLLVLTDIEQVRQILS